MTRCMYLQDDTGFAPLSGWTRTDGYSAAIFDERVQRALERYSGMDLALFRQVADADYGPVDWEAEPWLRQVDLPLEAIPADVLAPLHAALESQRAINEAAWVAPALLLDVLGRLRAALGPEGRPGAQQLAALLAEEHGNLDYGAVYVNRDNLYQEVIDLMVMTRHAIVRGASRVRFWVE